MLSAQSREWVSQGLEALATECERIATEHGWWDKPREVGTVMMLMVTEMAEAFEEFRNGNALDKVYCDSGPTVPLTKNFKLGNRYTYSGEHPIPDLTDTEVRWKPEGILVELADVLIRMLDTIEHEGLGRQFTQALWWKMRYNEARPYRHGDLKA